MDIIVSELYKPDKIIKYLGLITVRVISDISLHRNVLKIII